MCSNIEEISNIVSDIIQEFGIYDIEDENKLMEFNSLKKNREDLDLSKYGMDSLSFIRIIIYLEKKYSITFHESNLVVDNMNTVRKIYNAVLLGMYERKGKKSLWTKIREK